MLVETKTRNFTCKYMYIYWTHPVYVRLNIWLVDLLTLYKKG